MTTHRTLPHLSVFAGDVARALGGTAHLLDTGEYPSAAVGFGDRHPLLIRDHGWVLALSLPTEQSWKVQSLEEWRLAEPSIREALARGDHPVSMRDVVLAFAPVLARITNTAWEVSFPGTPVPQEAWLKHGARTVGLFQKAGSVSVVVWRGSSMRTRSIDRPDRAAALASWLEVELQAQAGVLEAEAAEAARKAALPLPDYDDIVAVLRAGARISTAGGRYYETFFWAGSLRREIFDEGETDVRDATEDELRAAIRRNPDPFREALERR